MLITLAFHIRIAYSFRLMNAFLTPLDVVANASGMVLSTVLSSLVVLGGVVVVRLSAVEILLGSISIIRRTQSTGVAQA